MGHYLDNTWSIHVLYMGITWTKHGKMLDFLNISIVFITIIQEI